MTFQNTYLGVLLLSGVVRFAHGYIPAQPSNETTQGTTGINASRLHLQWYSNGSDWEFVSYQLAGANSNGITQGALVHFSEDNAGNDTTTTPWIALVSCDTNSTVASQEVDIFTMARDRGAQSALLYSLFSETCAINPEYSDPANFDQVFDIFSTQTKQVSRIIEYEFGQFGLANESYYGYYNATMLNETEALVNQSIASNSPVAPGLLYATLQAYNATGSSNNNGSTNGNGASSSTSSSDGSPQQTGVAMIILYAITGCVSALFCIVIVSGVCHLEMLLSPTMYSAGHYLQAIRAIRHPERYGPRGADPTAGGSGSPVQSRARGLGRAILDTFPVVKFGSAGADQEPAARKDIEAPPAETMVDPVASPGSAVELGKMRTDDENHELETSPQGGGDPVRDGLVERHDDEPVAGGSWTVTHSRAPLASEGAQRPAARQVDDKVMSASIGRETCPICMVDFEEGDDLRVLPCEGKHRFHQSCVDPWLLELSGSCPICRQDFHALEAMLSEDVDEDPSLQRNSRTTWGVRQHRLSRYLGFARGHRGRDHDPTDPYSEGTRESSPQ
ncbi:hypothetical protein F5I97DRAFT_1925217 [Phlebopus sp. FC_14]|nr:hypothetical protein F5I97DRAFT_1925217 [Phlebopus sp. FC_14]